MVAFWDVGRSEGWIGLKRGERQKIARSTVEIVARGGYTAPSGQIISLNPRLQECLDSTRYYAPAELRLLRQEVLARPAEGLSTRIEVENETTLAGITRLLCAEKNPVAALNFASAKNPGGGFLNGSQAQEESLARSSALYPSLTRARAFYEGHRAQPSLLYSDAMILSPHCPIFRTDDGELLEVPHTASFITSAAPNAGALAQRGSRDSSRVAETLRQRAELVLALAAHHGYRLLVLGAWGCGVFRNDPRMVAGAFADYLLHGPWAGRFARICFSVYDSTPTKATFVAFRSTFIHSH